MLDINLSASAFLLGKDMEMQGSPETSGSAMSVHVPNHILEKANVCHDDTILNHAMVERGLTQESENRLLRPILSLMCPESSLAD